MPAVEQSLTNAAPQPAPSLDSAPFWDSLRAGRFAIQRCTACRQWQFPMLETCRQCSGDLALEPLSGKGELHTYLIEHQRVAPGFDALLPYPIALVTPEEAPHVRIPSRILGPIEQVRIGGRVQVEIIDLPGGDFKIPVFRLTPDGAA